MPADVVEVARAFETQGFPLESDDVASQCLAICRQFGASADDLALSWDQFYSSNPPGKMSATPSAGAMEAFRSHFERHVASSRKSDVARTPRAFYYDKPNLLESLEDGTVDADMADASLAAITPGRGGNTPGAKTAAARAAHARYNNTRESGGGVGSPLGGGDDSSSSLGVFAPAPGSSAFSKRLAPGAVKTELNPHLAAPRAGRDAAVASPPAVTLVGAPLSRDARYMRDRVSDKAEYLERRLARFRDDVEAAHPGLDCGGAVYAASQDDVCVVGRVVCDADNGRLNEASVQLEGSVATSGGLRVRLDLRALPRYSLFPGQIVCAQGSNPSGHCVVAKRIISAVAPPMLASRASAPAFGALSMVVASGPFTCADDLAYEPLDALLRYASETKPDAIVLLGPFVDCEHKIVRGDGEEALSASFDEVFARGVRDRLEAFLESGAASGYRPAVIASPSVRDATHDAVFPQPPLLPEGAVEATGGALVVLAPNPGTFEVNGVRVAVTTQDVLRHLSAAEAAREEKAAADTKKAAPLDRMARLAAHLPGQRSAYPLFPPAPGACMDAALAAHLDMERTPDVLILPSDLNPFAKVVPRRGAGPAEAEGASPLPEKATTKKFAEEEEEEDDAFVAVNPGRVAKGNIGGTFAHVFVAEGAPKPNAAEAQPHAVARRARVDVVRV